MEKQNQKARNLEVVKEEVNPKEKEILDTVERLKKKHKIKDVFVVRSGEKIGYLKRPSRDQIKYATQVANGNPLEMAEQLLNSGWLEGDEEIRTDDFHFYGVADALEVIMETAVANIKKY
ncbi:MAG: hypothetical protein AAF717_00345 [Bacteroidota bacterium]